MTATVRDAPGSNMASAITAKGKFDAALEQGATFRIDGIRRKTDYSSERAQSSLAHAGTLRIGQLRAAGISLSTPRLSGRTTLRSLEVRSSMS